jgi:hypothetical protein
MISAERLRALLHYDPEAGIFTRLVSTSSNARAGEVGGCLTGDGYRRIHVDGRDYLAHRLAWLYMTGAWPKSQIDHINRDKLNNRWVNLREATNGENQANRATLFGFKGAFWNKPKRKWQAQINCNNKRYHLGYFETQQEAAVAYAEAAKEFHGEFARPFNSRVTTPIMNNRFHSSLASDAPSCASLRDRPAPARVLSLDTGGLLAVSVIAWHEAGHCVVARYLGLPLGGATIVPTDDYGGLTFPPGTDRLNVTAATIREQAERECKDARGLMPPAGECRDCVGRWAGNAQEQVTVALAGFAGEGLAGFERECEATSTDVYVAALYARTVVLSDAAVPFYMEACRADTTEILKAHWEAVTDVAIALDEREMLTGEEIDAIIYGAESKAMHEAELQRRARMTAMTAKAKSGAPL